MSLNNEFDPIGGDGVPASPDAVPQESSPRMGIEEERAEFSEWLATAIPFDMNVGMAEHAVKTGAAWQAWMARAALQDFREVLPASMASPSGRHPTLPLLPPQAAPKAVAGEVALDIDGEPYTAERLAAWLDAKYARHGEDEDRQAAAWIRRAALSAPAERVAQPLTQAAKDVLAERRRQVEVEGCTPEHDDAHLEGELAMAAACYAQPAPLIEHFPSGAFSPEGWPWPAAWWKPKDRRTDLIRAAALLLAEIERLDRAGGIGGTEGGAQKAEGAQEGGN